MSGGLEFVLLLKSDIRKKIKQTINLYSHFSFVSVCVALDLIDKCT